MTPFRKTSTVRAVRHATRRRARVGAPRRIPWKISALAILLVTLLIATLLVVVGRYLRKDSAVPPALVGVWRTANAQYADRFFEITPTNIFFGLGDGRVEAQPIVAVDQARDEHGVIFTISYRNQDGQEFRFSFYYDPRDAGGIRFKHQRTIQWTKARPQP